MINPSNYYQPSKTAPVMGIVLALVLSLLAAIILAPAYIYGTRYIPIVYVCFIATIAYGFCVGWMVNVGAKIGKLRAPMVTLVIAVIVAIIAVYLQWAFFAAMIHTETPGETFRFFPEVLVQPIALFEFIKEFSNYGSWTIGKSTETVKGPFLIIIWIAEIGTIIFSAVVPSRNQASRPFSESLQQWATEKRMPLLAKAIDDDTEIISAMEMGDLSAIQPLQSEEDLDHHSTVILYEVEGDPESNYLSIETLSIKRNKKGKIEKKKTATPIKFLHITEDQKKQVEARLSETPAVA